METVRPVAYIVGLATAVLGLSMLLPLGIDLYDEDPEARAFGAAALLTTLLGLGAALACRTAHRAALDIQQTFLLTTGLWLILPIFGALPFVLGEPGVSVTDAFFESMSGMTTTGSTVFEGLDDMPRGTLLWRGMLQWFGGLGIVVVAIAFLPQMKVGGMQYFRSEAFDTFGKVLPRAAEIAGSLFRIYLVLTIACFVAYLAVGLPSFDAVVHALTTIATGGFSTRDASFGAFPGAAEYVCTVFMIAAALPFVRYLQLATGNARAIWVDPQIRALVLLLAAATASVSVYRMLQSDLGLADAVRTSLFNITSNVTGTGYASEDYGLWGGFPIATIFLLGLIGGCAGSTCCSVKIFRYQILFAMVRSQIQLIRAPHRVATPRYEGQPIGEDVLNSVIAFFMMFLLSLGIIAVALAMMGLPPITAISGATTALANIGPGLGPDIGPHTTFASLPEAAKWLLIGAMLLGRLELLSVMVLFTVGFWRR